MTNTNEALVVPSSAFRATAPGVELCLLRAHRNGGMTFLVRMAEGARAPLHDQPGGEETYMIAGRLRIEHRADTDGRALPDAVVATGEYFFADPGETHDGIAEEAALFFVVAPGGVAPVAR